MFINGILCNSEVWYPISQKDIDELEIIDKMLLKRIFNAPVSTPSESLLCPLCQVHKDRQKKLTNCSVINTDNANTSYCYSDMFGHD